MKWRRLAVVRGVGFGLFLAGIWLVPHRWCARESRAWYDGNAVLQQRLARGVEKWVMTGLGRQDFSTGTSQFNGEWLFGAYMMAAMGYGQTALEHPAWRARHVELMGQCIERILSQEVRAFDRESWGDDPIDSLDGDSDHAAYLGYFNLVLGLHRQLNPASKYAALNDRITAALIRRIEKSPTLLLQTYPGEVYPVDNCAVIASVALHGRTGNTNHQVLLNRWMQRCRERYIDSATGLLYQSVERATGAVVDGPRGSGTTLGAYFLSFADKSLSRDLYEASRRELAGDILGFGVVREYPRSVKGGRGDIDSGPIILGYSISAAGFSIAGSRIHRDAERYSRLVSTAYLFGAPLDRRDGREYVTGGPLGNALMFALLTAQP